MKAGDKPALCINACGALVVSAPRLAAPPRHASQEELDDTSRVSNPS
ncbi:hypothetical protein KCP76_12515 [Salmonella enterica subsp. enterica serovar Weltevreden]|nr:hypothetical protein KCP76_12515 [Salmonella enterica subsp. enterica serovar Weltevreden]